MKEAYVKPCLHVERFALSQSVASCNGVSGGGNTFGMPTHGDKTTCGWDMGGYIVWADAQVCTDEQLGVDEAIDGVCYNNPNGGCTIFGS